MVILDKREVGILLKILGNDTAISNLDDPEKKIIKNLRERLDSPTGIRLFVDGAANLEQKTAGLGGVAFAGETEIFRFTEFLAGATNNQAEYSALIKGLRIALDQGIEVISVLMDSELVVRQINGIYRVKNERMIPLFKAARELLSRFQSWEINHIPREKNTIADHLSKEGMSRKR